VLTNQQYLWYFHFLSLSFSPHVIFFFFQEELLKRGFLRVNGKTVKPDFIISNKDCIIRKLHQHETPVLDRKIEIVEEDSNFLVVNKPSSIPVHPTGKYKHNTLTFILAKEHGQNSLFPINRLDSPTSGVQIFGKNPE